MRPRLLLAGLFLVILASTAAKKCPAQVPARLPGELAWTIGYDPKTFDPAKVDDIDSETVRYLTAGVLLRFNRRTQKIEPRLAESWSISPDGRTITFKLRAGLRFSDGASLTARDAAWSIQRVLQPATGAPVAEEFVAPAHVRVDAPDAWTVIVVLPQRVIGIAKAFDEIAIEPAGRPSEAHVTSGPFYVAEYQPSQYVRLRRNPYYGLRDATGAPLPRASGVLLDIIENPEQQIRLFARGESDLIDQLPPEYYEMLRQKAPASVRDLGPSLNTEQMWFNQAPTSPLPSWEKAWFSNQAFRVAVSQAIQRDDIVRLVYLGHATPASSFVSPANSAWYDRTLTVPHSDLAVARAALLRAGFRIEGAHLFDAAGHPVKFSILTNAGNDARLKMATLIQQDLAAVGMQVNVVTLDFPALIERLMHTQDYEACLLGLENVDVDPNEMMNVWLSSSPNHQWNPSEKTPATAWETEIDKEMNLQATSQNEAVRKKAVDRVQQIVADEEPFIYLVYPNVLVAISPRIEGVQPAVIEPGLWWNVEDLCLRGAR
jgi:peptide/nickel transport system substrate-binding protein